MLIKLQNFIIKFICNLIFTKNKPKKIAIFRHGSFGDSIVAFPMIKTIRENYKDSEIHIYNKPEYDNLVKMEDLLHEDMYNKIFTINSSLSIKEFYKLIRKEKYDIWFELSLSGLSFCKALQEIVFLKMAGVKYVNGIKTSPNKFLSKYYKNHYTFISERQRLLNNLLPLNIDIEKYKLDFPLKDITDNMEDVKRKLVRDNLKKEKLIVLIVKSKRDSTTWSQNNWRKLSLKLLEKGYHIAFIGAFFDKSFINPIIRDLDKECVKSYAGEFSVMDSAALLKLSILTISVDTGPMHLSYAVGTKVIALFSARDYANKWYPPIELGLSIRKDIRCSPCFLNNCPIGNECINEINPKDILDVIDDKI